MNREALRDFEVADAKLNKAYRELVAAGLEDEDKEELKAAQRLWVQFRDTEAKFEANLEARGGTMQPLLYHSKRTELTEARTAELERIRKSGDR